MPNPAPIIPTRPFLRSEPQYRALVCLECNNGFPCGLIITRHLSRKHHIKANVYHPALEPFEHEPLAKEWEELGYPRDGSPPIEGLTIRPGFACIRCKKLTTSEDTAWSHLKCGQGQLHRVLLQCWNPKGSDKYWIVIPPQESITAGSLASQAGSRSL
jgi:hypothetical protein